MKFSIYNFQLPLLLTLFAFCLRAWGQYSVDWYTIDGGGGTSTNGTYSVTGTIGQPDAGTMSGGGFTLSGGFWSFIALVQTPEAPTLSISRAGAVVTISWPRPAEGWFLHHTNLLATLAAPWPLVPPPYQTNATDIFVNYTNLPPVGANYLRLIKP